MDAININVSISNLNSFFETFEKSVYNNEQDELKDFLQLYNLFPKCYFAAVLDGDSDLKKHIISMFEKKFIPLVNIKRCKNLELNEKIIGIILLSKLSPNDPSNLKIFDEVKFEHFEYLFLEKFAEIMKMKNSKTYKVSDSDFNKKLNELEKKLVIYENREQFEQLLLTRATEGNYPPSKKH